MLSQNLAVNCRCRRWISAIQFDPRVFPRMLRPVMVALHRALTRLGRELPLLTLDIGRPVFTGGFDPWGLPQPPGAPRPPVTPSPEAPPHESAKIRHPRPTAREGFCPPEQVGCEANLATAPGAYAPTIRAGSSPRAMVNMRGLPPCAAVPLDPTLLCWTAGMNHQAGHLRQHGHPWADDLGPQQPSEEPHNNTGKTSARSLGIRTRMLRARVHT